MKSNNVRDEQLGSLLIEQGCLDDHILQQIINAKKQYLADKDINKFLDAIECPNTINNVNVDNIDPTLSSLLVNLGFIDQDKMDSVLKIQTSDNKNDHEAPVEAKNVKIFPFRNVYISLGFIFTAIAACITASYGYFSYQHENKEQLEERDNKITELKNRNDKLTKKISDQKTLITQYKAIIINDKSKIPKPISFKSNSSIIKPSEFGNTPQILFKWVAKLDTKSVKEIENFIVIKNLSSSESNIYPINPNSEKEAIRLTPPFYSDYSWKIQESKYSNSKSSEEIKFTVYESTLNRVLKTRSLIVGTTRAVENNSTILDKHTFEGKLFTKLMEQLEIKLNISNIKIVKKIYKWEELLNSVKTGEVDIAIAGITATKQREKDYYPLKFSFKYKTNHQIFITRNDFTGAKFPDGLKNATVAINSGTTNMKAAISVLAEKYGFNIHKVPSFQDAYSVLHEEENVDFALIDSEYFEIYQSGFDNTPYGSVLDNDLKEFYMSMNGLDSEHYAIAVHNQTPIESGEHSLLDYINDILKDGPVELYLSQQKDIKNFINSSIKFN